MSFFIKLIQNLHSAEAFFFPYYFSVSPSNPFYSSLSLNFPLYHQSSWILHCIDWSLFLSPFPIFSEKETTFYQYSSLSRQALGFVKSIQTWHQKKKKGTLLASTTFTYIHKKRCMNVGWLLRVHYQREQYVQLTFGTMSLITRRRFYSAAIMWSNQILASKTMSYTWLKVPAGCLYLLLRERETLNSLHCPPCDNESAYHTNCQIHLPTQGSVFAWFLGITKCSHLGGNSSHTDSTHTART